ncbi:PREDICTED: solute carrier family 2, facilitated glucose transporter member 8-like [Branchiostoma belcheri]|uniref:Solute carrier family 2, facilitated glucose transporter member 8 n=1 Tax=Branchiostoma belcheri TaxID=7741 RepID=A0A6P4Y815_BRABE|nr:PREDICTED: solute carrier family 2, facilitated glucose transporter member 8-like [Branchiostoma belcheri]
MRSLARRFRSVTRLLLPRTCSSRACACVDSNNMATIQSEGMDPDRDRDTAPILAGDGGLRRREQVRNQFLATFVSTLGPLAFGMVLGYSSPALPDLKKESGAVHMDSYHGSWFGSLSAIGAMFGGPVGGWCIEALGRKTSLMTAVLPFTGGWLILAYAQNLAMLYVGRLLTGIAAGMTSLTVPVYVAEISSPRLRGLLGASFQLMVTIGILLVYVFGNFLGWRWLAIVCLLPAVILIIAMAFMPETPRWLLAKGRRPAAVTSLLWLRGPDVDVEDECADIESNLQQQESMSWREFTQPSLLKPFAIGMALMFFQQFSGINAVIFYSVSILEDAGVEGNTGAIIVGAVQVVATFVACLLMDKMGRRVLLIVAGTGMAITSVTFGLYFQLEQNNGHNSTLTLATTPTPTPAPGPDLSWLSLTSMIVYIIAFSLGWGPIPWLMMSEIFPSRARGTASGIATLFNWFGAFIVTKEFDDMVKAFTEQGAFWFFAGICLLGVLFVFFVVPETKNVSLEEIEAYFEGKGKPRSALQTSAYSSPPLEES